MNTYNEKIFTKWITFILGTISAVFLILWTYELFIGWTWTEPPSSWFWLVMFLFFLGLTINFKNFTINIDHEGITVGYGMLKTEIPWERVEDCYIDEASTLWYGGWGIRVGRIKGKWRTVYNVIGGPRVVVSLNEGWVREIVFSTKKPDRVIRTIRKNMGM